MTFSDVDCECGNKIYPDQDARIIGGLYECLTCHKFNAVDVDGKIVNIKELYDIDKYRNKIHELIPIDKELSIIKVENLFEEKILHAILHSRDPGTGFNGFYKPQKGTLLANKNEILGCIVWYKGNRARLNFILIRKEFRKNGYGTRFLKVWVKKITDKIADKYEIESPNRSSGSLLFKLGHLKMEGDKIIEVKCIIIESPGWSPLMLFNDF